MCSYWNMDFFGYAQKGIRWLDASLYGNFSKEMINQQIWGLGLPFLGQSSYGHVSSHGTGGTGALGQHKIFLQSWFLIQIPT